MKTKRKSSVTVRPDAARMSEVMTTLRKRIRAFGKRPLTEQDFQSICKRRGVYVIKEYKERSFMESIGGVYMNLLGIPTIILNGHASGFRGQWTMFHELG